MQPCAPSPARTVPGEQRATPACPAALAGRSRQAGLCCRSMQGCGLSADGNPFLQHCKAAWWHFGDLRVCRRPPFSRQHCLAPALPANPAATEHPAELRSGEKRCSAGWAERRFLIFCLTWLVPQLWSWGCGFLLAFGAFPVLLPAGRPRWVFCIN